MRNKMVPKNLTIQKDRDDWLKNRGGHINLDRELRWVVGDIGDHTTWLKGSFLGPKRVV